MGQRQSQIEQPNQSSTEDEIVLSFTNGIHAIKFPAPSCIPTRFQEVGQVDSGPTVNYIGRSQFKKVYDCILAKINSVMAGNVAVVGTIGSGKSHLLAAFVVCMRKLREAFPKKFMPVIYVPDCRLIVDEGVLVRHMKRQFELEGLPPVGFWSWNSVSTRIHLEQIVSKCGPLLFVFDNWNAVLDVDDLTCHNRIVSLTCENRRVVGLSARSQAITMNKLENYDQVNMYQGLPREEFDEWLGTTRLGDHWQRLTEGMSDVEKGEKLDEFYELTGGLPLLMSTLLREGVNTLQESYERYANDLSSDHFGGAWIETELEAFYAEKAPYQAALYKLWMNACFEQKRIIAIHQIADYRFFKKTDDVKYDRYRPICGFVRRYLSMFLRNLGWDKFVKSLANDHFVDSCLVNVANNSRSLQGFAYEAYCLKEIALDHNQVTDWYEKIGNQRSVVFNGNAPPSTLLTMNEVTASEIAFLIPTKWNLPFIDLCLRQFALVQTTASSSCPDASVEELYGSSSEGNVGLSKKRTAGEDGSRQQLKKYKNATDTSGCVLVVYAIQITLSTPEEHQRSLGFYVRPSRGGASPAELYAKHNLGDDVTVRHVFVWVTPHDVNSLTMPRQPRNAIEFHQKCVQIARPPFQRSRRRLMTNSSIAKFSDEGGGGNRKFCLDNSLLIVNKALV